MTALLKDTGRSYKRITFELVPLAAGVKAIKGGLAMLISAGTGAGYYAPADTGKTGVVKGIFAETVDNTAGLIGAASANIEYGEEVYCELMANDAGSPVLVTDRGKVCYALDDQTVTMAPGGCAAGVVHGISDDLLVEVELLPTESDTMELQPRIQSGTNTLAAGTKQITGVVLTATSRIFLAMKDPGAGVLTTFVELDAPVASRVVGTAGTFVVNAIDNAKATLATAVCTFDWLIIG
jgi:hypothetical protein